MRSMLFRRLLPLALCLPLLSTACSTVSTPASLARTERPRLPELPPNLTQTETLVPIAPHPSGQTVTIDKAVLSAITDALAEATGAVERLNGRVQGLVKSYSCTKAALEKETAKAC